MANLIGEPFDEYVSKQIGVRQKAHGSGTEGVSRTSSQLSYLNSKTAWIKLASGVYVEGDRIKKLGMSSGLTGKELAKNFVLQGGVTRIDKNGNPNFRGVNPDGKDRNGVWDYYTGPYNVNALSQNSSLEFGLVPMPGIEDAEIKFLNRGSIKRATVKMKAYNKSQFDIIDALYLRLGYTVLLEWGNGMYLDNGGNLQTNYSTLIDNSKGWFSDEFSKKTTNQILKSISNYRKGKAGNYDAMYAKVTNFTWSFNEDGSYDIELKLISHGDIIESLKFNTTPSILLSAQLQLYQFIFRYLSGEDESEDSEEAGADEPNPMDNIISAYLFLQKVYVYKGYATGIKNYFNNHDIGYIDPEGGEYGAKRMGIFVKPPPGGMSQFNIEISGADANVDSTAFNTFGKPGDKDIIYMNYVEEDDRSIHGKGFYMRFGHFLEFVQKNCMPVIQSKGGSEDDTYPILNIDYDEWNNQMLYYPNQTSLDPRVCVVNSYIGRYKIFNAIRPWTQHDGENNFNADKSDGYAWTMNIYLNHDLIQNAINENLDDQGNVAFFPMISSICTGLNKALGGINNLEPVIDEENSILKIIDSSFSKDPLTTPKFGVIETFGYNNKNQTSNFVRNIDLKTEITKEYADMITIGATAGGYVKGTEATAFSKWSKGYIDRFKEKVLPPTTTIQKPAKNESAINYFNTYYNAGIDSMLGYKYIDVDDDISSVDAPQLQDDLIDNNVAIVTEYYRYINEKAREITKDETDSSKQFSSKTNGFIPFNLGLTLDGISGIKIYNKLDVNTRFLPQNYPDALQFIIKGVNHKLSNNDWETKLETQTIPASLNNQQSFQTLFGIVAADILSKGKNVTYKSIVDTRPKDQDGNNDYKPGDNPTYTPVQPYTPVKTAPAGWDGLSTLTSGFPLKSSQYRKNGKQKTQIYLHYTAGHQKSDKGKGTCNTLYGKGLSCHAVIDIDGHIERMVPDEYSAFCQGKSDRQAGDIYPNQTGLSVEIQSLGYERSGTVFNSYGKGQPLVGCVDWLGNPISEYRGHKKYQEFSDAQIGATKELCLDWLKNHNISFKWDKQYYDDMFPPKGTTSRAVLGNKPGIWSHNSVKGSKSDVMPSPKMIKMLQEISDEVNGPTQAELVEIQLQLEEKHKAYKKKLKGWSDQLYRSMKGPNTYEGIFNKVVAETNAEERMDIAVYFDSFASFNRVKTQDNRKDYKNQFRLSKYKEGSFDELAPNGSILGRWGGKDGYNYTKEKGQAPLLRIDDDRYGGYTLYEWIIGDFSGATETKNLKLFGYNPNGNIDTKNKIYKKTSQ
tara:strand:+ start:652 stop:4539 length:3888 start_codon:yes stop_codon:yes gene_type:complete